ncbi:MAG: SMC-Scp complex subunit ScpB [Candidatus Pacebacteria bacterium]|nr:SMC-Scp complex subunit ScpB [Candidatus Paceibacterota bacterium]
MDNLLAKIEAVLFAYGEPISLEKLAKILKIEMPVLESALDGLNAELTRQERGLMLARNSGKIQLVTKPELTKLLEDIVKQEFTEDLTPAALETISIIAYAGPISWADIEYIRGVNSSFTVRNLLLRGLVERSIDPKRANAYIYTVSFDLLKRLGLSKIEELPDHEKYKQMVKSLHEASLNQKSEKAEILTPEAEAPKTKEGAEPEQNPEQPATQNNQDNNNAAQ